MTESSLESSRGANPGRGGGEIPFCLLHGSVLAVGGWIALPSPWWGAVAGVGGALALLLSMDQSMDRRRVWGWSGVLVLLAVLSIFVAERHLGSLAREWPVRAQIWEEDTQDRLAGALDGLLDSGEAALDSLSLLWARTGLPRGNRIPDHLMGDGIDALALFSPSGRLLGWTGVHQGPVPEDVRFGTSRYLYREGALFGYLYVTEPLPDGGGTAVAISLLRADLPVALETRPISFTQRFEAATGARIRIARADRLAGESVWDLRWDDETLLSVSITPASEGEARARVLTAWSRWLLLLVAGGWLAAMLGGRGLRWAPPIGAGALLALLLAVPVGRLVGLGPVVSPASFLLPGPIPLTLGQILAIAGAGSLGAGLLSPGRRPLLPIPVAGALGVVTSVLLLRLFASGAPAGFRAGPEGGWVLFQIAGSGATILLLWLSLLLSRDEGRREEGRPLILALALALAGLLAAGWAVAGDRNLGISWTTGVVWVLPFTLLLLGLPAGSGWRAGALRWGSVAALATTLTLSWGWNERLEARVTFAEDRIERLGTRPDPFLEFLLLRGGEEGRRLAVEGVDPVEVLYGSWTASGLALEGVPLWITLWGADGVPREELRIGVADSRPEVPPTFLADVRTGDEILLRRLDLADTHYMAAALLPRGEIVTFVIPPRRRLSGESPLGPLFAPARGDPDPLVLIPLLPGELPGATGEVEWVRSRDGWQGEVYLVYPDELYHAHYHLELPGFPLLLARGTILLFLSLPLLGSLWGLGGCMGSGVPGGGGKVLGALSSFRGRVTLTLFAFFLVPSLLFGTLAYRTLAGASVRTAEVLARRAVDDAAAWFPDVAGQMDQLATRVGSDLLLFENGELISGSTRELLGLGLYEGWLPPEIHAEMARGEEVMTTTIAALGGWEYVMAYRRISSEQVLATPAPLQAGATALRQGDVADLIGFAVLLGGALSVLLSLLVGRALTLPIQTLQIASERVGAGNMGVQLPEDRRDEFGSVFGAFNRMVNRLAQTRRALLRSSRRTRAIVEEVAIGVVALDRHGRVTLANPRAAELLGGELRRGHPLVGADLSDPVAENVVTWVAGFFRDGLGQGGTEVTGGQRRIRVRARRIVGKSRRGGAVLTLEDVTDELRSERILAWGEMAQQVAHEVKNPLTPIRLGIQHVRRAWEDRRPDFDEILNRNVDAIVREIDRLAAIATSFSRYAAPSPLGPAPLEPVEVGRIVDEVLDLYQAAEGPVGFSTAMAPDLPPVATREGELKEVLINLLENARSAQPTGGRVVVEGELSASGDEVELRVRDKGPGIPAELISRIFEPHFSTRSGGTGLGLAIVRRLVESWGGTVGARSAKGEGTVLVVRVPVWRGGEGGAPSGG